MVGKSVSILLKKEQELTLPMAFMYVFNTGKSWMISILIFREADFREKYVENAELRVCWTMPTWVPPQSPHIRHCSSKFVSCYNKVTCMHPCWKWSSRRWQGSGLHTFGLMNSSCVVCSLHYFRFSNICCRMGCASVVAICVTIAKLRHTQL